MNTILSTAFIVLTGACVALIYYFLSKWMQRIEYKIDSVRRMQSVLNVNQLTWLRSKLIDEEMYEEVKRIDEVIKKEMESTE